MLKDLWDSCTPFSSEEKEIKTPKSHTKIEKKRNKTVEYNQTET